MSSSPDRQQQDVNQIELSPKPDRDNIINYMLVAATLIGSVSGLITAISPWFGH